MNGETGKIADKDRKEREAGPQELDLEAMEDVTGGTMRGNVVFTQRTQISGDTRGKV